MAIVESFDHSQQTHVHNSDGLPVFGTIADIAVARNESRGVPVVNSVTEVMGAFAVENVLPDLSDTGELADSQA